MQIENFVSFANIVVVSQSCKGNSLFFRGGDPSRRNFLSVGDDGKETGVGWKC